ncbi:MAG: type III secretion system chaperone [Rhabdochlamydiaceae bacterium]|nr:type III secretion system chaperone [Rhabdochlamydiaceae bacterium]
MLEEHLKQLAEDLELPPLLPKDKSSCYYLPLANDFEITVRSLKNGCAFFSKVAAVPTQKREEAFLYFMAANLLGQGTGNQVLGIDPEEKFLTLSCIIPYDMNYKEFKEKIEDFANYLNYWRVEAEKREKDAQASIL